MFVLRHSEDREDSEDLEESRNLKLPVDRSFPAFSSRNGEDGADIKNSASFETEDMGYEGKKVLDHVKEQEQTSCRQKKRKGLMRCRKREKG